MNSPQPTRENVLLMLKHKGLHDHVEELENGVTTFDEILIRTK